MNTKKTCPQENINLKMADQKQRKLEVKNFIVQQKLQRPKKARETL